MCRYVGRGMNRLAFVSAMVLSCTVDSRELSVLGNGSGAAPPDASAGELGQPGAARLVVEPVSLDFGPAVVGSASRARLTVSNAGDTPLSKPSISMLADSSPDFVILHNQCENVVGPAEGCDVRIQLLADAPGQSTAAVGVEAGGQNARVSISGFGLVAGPLTLAPAAGSSADFGSVLVAGSYEQAFEISNPTSQPSGPLTFVATEAQFQVLPAAAGDCQPGETTLANGESCRVRLVYRPTRRGAVDGSLVVTAESLGSSSLPLAGFGLSPAAIDAPDALEFGAVVIGGTAQRSLQVRNAGDQPLELSEVTLSSSVSATSELVTPATGTISASSSPFSVQNSDCGGGEVLAAGASCSVTVLFRPLALSPDQQAQLVISAITGAQHTIPLRGSALPLGSLAVTPAPGASRDFGEHLVGESSTQYFVVTNPSAQPSGPVELHISEPYTIAPSAAAGECATGVTSLANGESCSLAITLIPSERGPQDGSLTVSSALAGAASLALTGRGLGPARIALARAELDFGRVPTQSPVRQALTFRNVGDQPLSGVQASVESPGGPAAAFSLQGACDGEIGADASCDMVIEFLPTEATNYSGVLRLTSASGAATSALLLGRAFPRGALELSAVDGTGDFGDVAIGAPRTLQFTLANPGNVASGRLTITSSSPLFSVDLGDCNTAGGAAGLASAETCTFGVTFSPIDSEQIAANLSVQSPGAGEAALPLSGRGRVASNLSATGARDFGVATVGQMIVNDGNQFTWTVTNDGDLASGSLQVVNTNPAEFIVSNDTCSNVSVPGRGSCTLDILFRATERGPRSATLSVTDSTTLETLQFVMTGTGLVVAQPGESCLNGETCASGVCTAGVCCDRDCAATCQVCTAGVCSDQAGREACGIGEGQCFGVNKCLLPEGSSCSGDEQCGSGNCERRLGAQAATDSICCLEDCGATGQFCNPETGRCQAPDLGSGAACGAAGQPACAAGLECKECRGGGRQCTPPDGCCGGCESGYECIDGACGCALGSNGIPQIDCGRGQCILDREFACCTSAPECPANRPACDGTTGLCVQCLSNDDCGPCATCGVNKTCTPIARGQAGVGCPAGALCDGNGACFSPQCTGVGQCGDCRTCNNFGCVNAGAGATCSQNRVCTADQRCVQCISNMQCGAGQRCELTTNTCVSTCVPSLEVCDGRDNDCDGQVDENATSEVCDGVDNDCDGQVDDGFSLQNDPNNCGQCGRSCGGGTCNAGRCGLPDGQPCTSPNECQSGICTRWLVDADGDGFGSEPSVNGYPAVQICGQGSGANRPPPHVAVGCRAPQEFQYEPQSKDANNRPDCCDNPCPGGALNTVSSATAFPGNTVPGTTAANCAAGVFSADFNCDGALEFTPDSPGLLDCAGAPAGSSEQQCAARSGFLQAPECGVEQAFIRCSLNASGECVSVPVTGVPPRLAPTCR